MSINELLSDEEYMFMNQFKKSIELHKMCQDKIKEINSVFKQLVESMKEDK